MTKLYNGGIVSDPGRAIIDPDMLVLPIPGKDPMPPHIEISEADAAKIKEDKKDRSALLDVKNDTESRVKYVMENLFGASLRKDGDYSITPGGQSVWRKRIADYFGVWKDGRALYVEVKGVSPGNDFSFSRLDRPHKEGAESQHDKLQAASDSGIDVLLAIGWWHAKHFASPVMDGKRKRWKKQDLMLEIMTIRWGDWVDFYEDHEWRSLSRKRGEHYYFEDDMVYKTGRQWAFARNHWWF